MPKGPEAFRTISEVADDLDVPKHVLRFWEAKFSQVKPMKRGGGRRYYRPEDVALLKGIRHLLYSEGYTIRGVQKILRENGPRSIMPERDGEMPIQQRPPQIPDVAADAAQSRAEGATVTEPHRAPGDEDLPGGDRVAYITAILEELDACKRLLADAKKA
ncbi:MerR family regulatory protein [Methyloligella halotolerans]|uniref:MerR family regulatory protein n=1 Tax=Methyloligella halotolerans TaxID=1177755 RepID=A0A1E2S234_9HYPH|nr:MerR family transcriptional regulator [Methyloligella halotolerans]ODA68563.1 MerR family regulatory protein [Methyloligella halotolerans]